MLIRKNGPWGLTWGIYSGYQEAKKFIMKAQAIKNFELHKNENILEIIKNDDEWNS